MPKYYGKIGFSETVETAPGVWEETIKERNYYGEVLDYSIKNQLSDSQITNQSISSINSNIIVDNKISIMSDLYAYQNFVSIKYITWLGSKWLVSNAKISRPRMILTLGGLYIPND